MSPAAAHINQARSNACPDNACHCPLCGLTLTLGKSDATSVSQSTIPDVQQSLLRITASSPSASTTRSSSSLPLSVASTSSTTASPEAATSQSASHSAATGPDTSLLVTLSVPTAIAGIVVALLVVAIWACCRRRQRRRNAPGIGFSNDKTNLLQRNMNESLKSLYCNLTDVLQYGRRDRPMAELAGECSPAELPGTVVTALSEARVELPGDTPEPKSKT